MHLISKDCDLNIKTYSCTQWSLSESNMLYSNYTNLDMDIIMTIISQYGMQLLQLHAVVFVQSAS